MVRGHEHLLTLELLLPVFNGTAAGQRSVQVMVKSHVVSMLHAVCLIADERQEFPFLVIFLGHCLILLVSSLAESSESIGVIVDHPAQTGVVLSRNVRPHRMRRDADEVQLSLCRLKGIPHVSMTIGEVAVIMEVSPEHLHSGRSRHYLPGLFAAWCA